MSLNPQPLVSPTSSQSTAVSAPLTVRSIVDSPYRGCMASAACRRSSAAPWIRMSGANDRSVSVCRSREIFFSNASLAPGGPETASAEQPHNPSPNISAHDICLPALNVQPRRRLLISSALSEQSNSRAVRADANRVSVNPIFLGMIPIPLRPESNSAWLSANLHDYVILCGFGGRKRAHSTSPEESRSYLVSIEAYGS